MTEPAWQPRGLLNPQWGEQKFQITRHAPAPELAGWIERYWIIRWDLRGEPPYSAQTLPQPFVNLVFEAEQARIYGVASRMYTNELQDEGQVFGVKFKPGAFYPLLQQPVASITDRSLPVADIFGEAGVALGQSILQHRVPAPMLTLANDFLHQRLPPADETVGLVDQIVGQIMADRTITHVDDIAQRFALSKRTLQRLFHQYVGVSPKWVITRYRLHDAAEQLADGKEVALPTMALDLGYFDQAHFSKAFKASIGVSPTEYMRLAQVSG